MSIRNFVLFGLALGLLVSFGCLGPSGETTPPEDDVDTSNAVTEGMCKQYGGNWDSDRCQCGGIAGFSCPPAWVCTDLQPGGAADAMGTCKRVSQ
ncbi:MAG: hypothetical protein ABII71_01895 [Candidatus Micrarchaeota archaeon]